MNQWTEKMRRIDNPPEPAKPAPGTVTVRFLKSFPGGRCLDMNVPAFAAGEVARFPPAVAAELYKAGIVEYVDKAA